MDKTCRHSFGRENFIYLNMNRSIVLLVLVLSALGGHAQKMGSPGYMDSVKAFRADYVQTHELLTTAEQKALLGAKADVVDMESFDVVKEGYAWGARGVAIRAISDRSNEDLPIDFNRTISSNNRVSILRVVAEVAKKPGTIGSLIRFGRKSRGAAETLARFLETYVMELVQLVPTEDSLKVVAR